MNQTFLAQIAATLTDIETDGLTKRERLISGPQNGRIEVEQCGGGSKRYVNLCSNNYLGLANHPDVVAAARLALDEFGYGMASVRFICGTQTLHRTLEQAIARYLGKDDAILFAACFDANGGVFEPLFEAADAIVSDSLNHASIIDGIRLCKAQRYRFANGDINELEDRLKEAQRAGARFTLIATDSVFSMDGTLARFGAICDLAERYDAIVMVDDCHATGHIGPQGRGGPASAGEIRRVNIVTGTFGKTLGGGMGGFVAADQPIVDLLRQRARPYLFSNSLAPPLAAGALKAIEICEEADNLRGRLVGHAQRFRAGLAAAGFDLIAGETPIIPVMLYDARRAQDMARELDARGIFVAGFFFPIVPRGRARIRTQMSAALHESDVDNAIGAFTEAGRALGII